jgi:hypothetical protein
MTNAILWTVLALITGFGGIALVAAFVALVRQR